MSDSDSTRGGARDPHQRIEWLDLAKVFSESEPDLDFIWPGFLAGSVGVLAAPGSSGKSWWAIEAMCAVAAGRDADLLDLSTNDTGDVVYLCLEDVQPILAKRLCRLRERFNEDIRARLIEQLRIAPLAGWRLDLLDCRFRDWLASTLDGARLCVIDTLSRAHGGDENSNAEMSRLLSNLEWVCSKTGCAVLFTHHVRKGGAGEGPAQQAARGASALLDNARWGGGLLGMTESESETLADADRSLDPLSPCPIRARRSWYVKFQATKPNYGPPQEDVWYRREDGGVLVPARLEYMPATVKSRGAAPHTKVAQWCGRPAKE